MPTFDYQRTIFGDVEPVQSYSVKDLLSLVPEDIPQKDRVRLAWMHHPVVNGFVKIEIPSIVSESEAVERYVTHLNRAPCFETFARSARACLQGDSNSEPPKSLTRRVLPKWYVAYLATEHWHRMKVSAKSHYFNCGVCGRDDEVQVHHKTYVRLGQEKLMDVGLLCDDCHVHVHAWLGLKVPSQMPSAVRHVLDREKVTP